MSDFSQTVPELVAWARKNDFALTLPTERLAFLLAIATLNGERLDGEMSEGIWSTYSVMSARHLNRRTKPSPSAPTMRLTIWLSSACLTALPASWRRGTPSIA